LPFVAVPAVVTAVQPPADHRAAAAAEPTAPATKFVVTVAVFTRLRASPATANRGVALRLLRPWMATSSRTMATTRTTSET
jgi:hypothetical protein